jgi:hypothetical protein
MGATVVRQARDIAAFDIAVLVKRPSPGLVERIHAAGVPLIWDIVDAYPQPQSDGWNRDESVE